ncbi:MAG: sel1 repeat family protein [Deltaproteobacteria bacterium]|nr:sel1 repeat family protein [Deltaproteobacteria bacterium]
MAYLARCILVAILGVLAACSGAGAKRAASTETSRLVSADGTGKRAELMKECAVDRDPFSCLQLAWSLRADSREVGDAVVSFVCGSGFDLACLDSSIPVRFAQPSEESLRYFLRLVEMRGEAPVEVFDVIPDDEQAIFSVAVAALDGLKRYCGSATPSVVPHASLLRSLRGANATQTRSAASASCKEGDGSACATAGSMALYALGGPREEAGCALLGRACDLENTDGCLLFGWRKIFGFGCSQDAPAGEQALQRGCKLGDAKACDFLAYVLEQFELRPVGPGELQALKDRVNELAGKVPEGHGHIQIFQLPAGGELECVQDLFAVALSQLPSPEDAPAHLFDYWSACQKKHGSKCFGPTGDDTSSWIDEVLDPMCKDGYGYPCYKAYVALGFTPSVAVGETDARSFVALACERGYAAACYRVRYHLLDRQEPDFGQVQRFLERGCQLGDAGCCLELGTELEHQIRSCTRPPDRTFYDYYRKACDLGSTFGCRHAMLGFGGAERWERKGPPGECAESLAGSQVLVDEHDAQAFMKRACQLGDDSACLDLADQLRGGRNPGSGAPNAEGDGLLLRACKLGKSTACGLLGILFDPDPAATLAEARRVDPSPGPYSLVTLGENNTVEVREEHLRMCLAYWSSDVLQPLGLALAWPSCGSDPSCREPIPGVLGNPDFEMLVETVENIVLVADAAAAAGLTVPSYNASEDPTLRSFYREIPRKDGSGNGEDVDMVFDSANYDNYVRYFLLTTQSRLGEFLERLALARAYLTQLGDACTSEECFLQIRSRVCQMRRKAVAEGRIVRTDEFSLRDMIDESRGTNGAEELESPKAGDHSEGTEAAPAPPPAPVP